MPKSKIKSAKKSKKVNKKGGFGGNPAKVAKVSTSNKHNRSSKSFKSALKAEVLKVAKAHGFIKDSAAGTEYFVSGRDLFGAITGDVVLYEVVNTSEARARSHGVSFPKIKSPSKGGALPEARVVRILEKSENILTGTVVELKGDGYKLKDKLGGKLGLYPDTFGSREPLIISSYGGFKIAAGDKVRFVIKTRGDRHNAHLADITHVYGSSLSAKTCVEAYLEEKNIAVNFSEEVLEEADYYGRKIDESEIKSRLDLRNLPIFTIDGADTKDIDDAVNIEKTNNGYKLGVHIADVSHYVTEKSALDEEALRRGTSVYIADLVVPMLPKALSNGICSLNPNEDRLAFSCLMEISKDGELKSFEFKKTIIRSRIQGVYSEINSIISNSADEIILEKYKEVIDQIPLMQELAEILKKARENRGAPRLETSETKIICGENGECVDVKRRESGISENIIEEFMLMANNSAAKLAMTKKFPFVYRVHEAPDSEKLTKLSETLLSLGIDAGEIKPTAPELSRVLELAKSRSIEKYEIVNMAVLRSMMKAKYAPEPLGHFGLVMKEYAHFTSPIRRYPDLAIHRILSDFVVGDEISALSKKYFAYANDASLKSSLAELKAASAERDCKGYYCAEYMTPKIGEEFDGVISGVTENSLFIMLENTVEGRVALPYGNDFKLSGGVSVINEVTGTSYTLGDKVRVRCSGCSVPMGAVDFVLI